ncbi:MAG: hypothetical protein P1P85_04945 [Patescibacteria group bacterium]|nr:hypothetical protein [Patescibacteria group bacterium]
MVKKKTNKKEVAKSITKMKKSTGTNKKSKAKKVTKKKIVKKVKKKAFSKNEKKEKVINHIVENQTEDSDYFAKWKAPEYIKTQQDMILYYVGVVLSVISVIYFYFQGSFITVLTFMILFVVMVLYIYQEPREIEYKIDLDGISLDDVLFRFTDIESFEIEEGEYFNFLKFGIKNSVLPIKEVFLDSQDPLYIRAVLENFLIEEKQKSSLVSYKKKDKMDEYISDEDFSDYLDKKEKIEKLNKKNNDSDSD